MRVSSIQRMSVVVIMISLIFWFYRKQVERFDSGFPLISVAQTTGLSRDLHSDKFFCEKVLQMKLFTETDSSLIFVEGLILEKKSSDSLQTKILSLRTRRLSDTWNEIIASPIQIISPPTQENDHYSAIFKLPGGQSIQLVEY